MFEIRFQLLSKVVLLLIIIFNVFEAASENKKEAKVPTLRSRISYVRSCECCTAKFYWFYRFDTNAIAIDGVYLMYSNGNDARADRVVKKISLSDSEKASTPRNHPHPDPERVIFHELAKFDIKDLLTNDSGNYHVSILYRVASKRSQLVLNDFKMRTPLTVLKQLNPKDGVGTKLLWEKEGSGYKFVGKGPNDQRFPRYDYKFYRNDELVQNGTANADNICAFTEPDLSPIDKWPATYKCCVENPTKSCDCECWPNITCSSVELPYIAETPPIVWISGNAVPKMSLSLQIIFMGFVGLFCVLVYD